MAGEPKTAAWGAEKHGRGARKSGRGAEKTAGEPIQKRKAAAREPKHGRGAERKSGREANKNAKNAAGNRTKWNEPPGLTGLIESADGSWTDFGSIGILHKRE